MNELCLFALGGYRDFGLRVAHCLGLDLLEWEGWTFADGEHRANPCAPVRGRHVVVMQSLRASRAESVDGKLCRLLFFIGVLKDGAAERVTVVVPYLCYARQDRRDDLRDPLTSRYVAQLLEAVGTDRLLTLDVHNPAAFQNAFRHGAEHLETTGLFVEHIAGAGQAAGGLRPAPRARCRGGAAVRPCQPFRRFRRDRHRAGGDALGRPAVRHHAKPTRTIVPTVSHCWPR
ncbi:ribose-phosphate pyrophosphokinase-like domain-containing protein [Denitratisoma sp. DHT3]|uniref:ribose-phosphate pyrophosphokinase-like domain-containing protein n=1 Tax=Denitratisoma sp. DHT3 TaxID=1981880 RepID=UPI001C96AF89|nr:ribose-phosphate pyrophosphokinase-like domain-containing protein [Denitratisoma sp. DHT3]